MGISPAAFDKRCCKSSASESSALASKKPLAKQTAPPALSLDSSLTISIVLNRFTPIKVASGALGSSLIDVYVFILQIDFLLG